MDRSTLIEKFKNPDVSYRGKPFWSWNGELKSDELIRQARIMKEMGLGGYFMHSRSGLITEYLSDEWFDLICKVADESEKLGLEAWLYDEDRWPSGSAGGMVTRDRRFSMKSLYLHEYDVDARPEIEGNTVAIFVGAVDGINLISYKRVENDCVENISKVELINSAGGKVKVLHFTVIPKKSDSNYNGETYIDTMSYAATERFIELTHEKYKQKCGDRLGRSIKGIFTDEPHRGHCLDKVVIENGVLSCPICYTDDIFDEFSIRYGYDPIPILPELFYRYKNEKVSKIKLHYLDLANNLFIERFAMPINKWCEENNMIFTGHVLHEDSLMNQTSPNGSLMRFYEHMGAPGIDCLSEYNTSYWIVKQLSSVARQLGKKQMLSELYGATGWEFNFKSHKSVGDWQALLGINLRCHHLSWYTMEGESKRDYPASILHQSPWWKEYSTVEDYFARFGLIMSEGKPACDVLLLNPIESLWCQAYIGWANWIINQSPDVAIIEERYARLFHILLDNHIDFDYGEEFMMQKHAYIETIDDVPYLCIGKMKYKTVIVSNMLTIRQSTCDLLEKFISLGGKVIFSGDAPEYVDGEKSDAPKMLSDNAIKTEFDEQQIIDAVKKISDYTIDVTDSYGNNAYGVFLQMREDVCKNSDVIAVINTNTKEAKDDLTLKIKHKNCFVNIWDMNSGERYSMTHLCSYDGENISIPFSLLASGSICFELTESDENLPAITSLNTEKSYTLDSGLFDYELDEDNVCVLDMAKWKIGDGEWQECDEVLRVDSKVRDFFGIEHRGGEMLQPWFAKNFDKQVYSKVCLEYSFDIDVIPKSNIYLAAERPELMDYEINGYKLSGKENGFWIDDCFKKMEIPKDVLKLGKNSVCVTFDFMRTSNIEAIYLVGEFGVRLEGTNRYITSLMQQIGFGKLELYSLPFYTGKVTYKIPHSQIRTIGQIQKDQRVTLSVKNFTGAYAEVVYEDNKSILAWEPYECDITDAYINNSDVSISVMGTRRNTFGPLHLYPAIQYCYGPDSFKTSGGNWTYEYSLIDSGISCIDILVKNK